MMYEYRKHSEVFATRIIYIEVTELLVSKDVHTLTLDSGETVKAHTVIIATGASAKWLGLPSEKKFMNKGVSACAVCDGFFFRGEKVAVVGGGDTAAEESTYLSKMCPEVHLLVRRDEMRASKIMQERVMSTENIKIHWNTEAQEVLGNGEVTGLRVVNNQTNEESQLDVKAFFVAIGHTPNTAIFKDQLKMDETGYIITEPKSTHTRDRKSTRLNSSHVAISYAVFCLKKKKEKITTIKRVI